MKKIVYLTVFANPFQYEFTESVKKILCDRAEFEVVYEKKPPGFRKHWGEFNNGTILGEELKFRDYLEQENPDVLILTMYNSKKTVQAIKWAHKNNKTYYFGPHEVLRGDGVHPLVKQLKLLRYKYIAKGVAGIMTMGNQSVKELSTVLPQKRVISIPYSFSLERLLNFEKVTFEDELVFLLSGRLYDFRNPLLGIRIFGKLVHANPQKNIKLLISGTGPLYDHCLQLIDSMGISDRVSWKNDFADWYDIHNLYKHADVLLALQNYGTWGLIIQEAMAAGLGIVSTNTIQSADTNIISGYNGFLTTFNEETILDCMQKYVDDFQLCETHGQRNREAVQYMDVRIASKKFVDFISPNL